MDMIKFYKAMDKNPLVCCIWNIIFLFFWIFGIVKGSELSNCVNMYQVHLSDLQVIENTYEDGHYCTCSTDAFSKADPNFRFSWYHYERTDWVLHFYFCHPVIPSRTCTPEEQEGIVATIVVNEDKWNPTRDLMPCHCGRDKIYFMHSWKLHSTGDNKSSGLWKYHFTCDSKLCKPGQACVKHYLDHAASHTSGFSFTCHCAEGYHCPVGNGGQKIQSYDVNGKDDIGPFISSYCVELRGWKAGEPKRSE